MNTSTIRQLYDKMSGRELYDTVLKVIMTKDPQAHVYQKFLSTLWEQKGGYPPAKDVVRMVGAMRLNAALAKGHLDRGEPVPEFKRAEFALGDYVSREMVKHDLPFRFVDRGLFDALLHTAPPRERWDFETNPMPLPAICFVFPSGVCPSDDPEQSIDLLFVCCTEAQTERGIEPMFIAIGYNVAVDATWWVNAPAGRMPLFGPEGLASVPYEVFGGTEDSATNLKVALANHRLLTLSYNLIGIMNARPEFMSGGEVVKHVKGAGGNVRAVRKIPMLGATYRRRTSKSSKGEGTGTIMPEHWRVGHWHTVSFGPGHLQKRKDWFEPIHVNAPEA